VPIAACRWMRRWFCRRSLLRILKYVITYESTVFHALSFLICFCLFGRGLVLHARALALLAAHACGGFSAARMCEDVCFACGKWLTINELGNSACK
jgi:hypothetical protein